MLAHFIHFSDFDFALHRRILARAVAIKNDKRQAIFAGRFLLLFFTCPSTRTRISFAAAMAQGGGGYQMIDETHSQISRGEDLADTARAISAMCDAVAIRTKSHADIQTFAQYAQCPVINALSDREHPCQIIADILSYEELRGDLCGRKIAWVGDCNNVFNSWAAAAQIFGCQLRVAAPAPYRPVTPPPNTYFTEDAKAAADGADLVMTDVCMSMGDTDGEKRRQDFAAYTVDDAVMAAAAKDAVFMHCLPAHRGEEVSSSVIDGEQSAVWRQAENRLHAQKALLEHLFSSAAA